MKNQYEASPDEIVKITFLEKYPTVIAIREP